MKKVGKLIIYIYIGFFCEGWVCVCIGGDLWLIEDKVGRKLEVFFCFLLGKKFDLMCEF